MKKNFFIITAVVCGMSCTTTAYAQFKIGCKAPCKPRFGTNARCICGYLRGVFMYSDYYFGLRTLS